MKKLWMLILTMVPVTFMLVGCCTPGMPSVRFAAEPGKKSIQEAVDALDAYRENVLPVRARGDLKYISYEDGRECSTENFGANLRFVPPRRLYFKANSVLGEAVWLGSNDQEFWFRMKPKEFSLYWWGKWYKLRGCPSLLMLSPETMLEGLGMVKVDTDWMLLDQEGMDVLVKLDDQERFFKRVYVNRAGYLVEKIEYYDNAGYIGRIVELYDYAAVPDGSPIPLMIHITLFDRGVPTSKVEIKLRNPKPIDPGMVKKGVFKRPPEKGLKYIYELGDDCKFKQYKIE